RALKSLPPLPADVHPGHTALPTLESLGVRRNEAILAGGERAAQARLRKFLGHAEAYARERDRMDLPGTSRLSADIKFGTLSIRRVWTAIEDKIGATKAAGSFLNELVWREFTHSTLWDHPELLEKPFQPAYEGFPWRYDEALWNAWVEGRTGYPV